MKAKQKQIKKQSTARSTSRKPVSLRSQKVTRKTSTRPKTSLRTTSTARTKAKTPVRAKIKHSTKKALVPHKENDFRPHLIRAHGLVAVLIIALVAQLAYGFFTTGHLSVLGRVSHITTKELLKDTNNERVNENLAGLTLNEKLSQAAFLKAQDMFKNDYWAHTSPNGTQPWKWFGDVGYNYSYAGENLAKNYPTAAATVEAWMESPTHRANIVNPHYTDIGFAVVDGVLMGQNTTLVVALYGAPVVSSAVQAAASKADTFSGSLVNAPVTNPFEYFGTALQSVSPVTMMVLILLAVVGLVGAIAHRYRKQLPKAWQRSWRLHHGMYTFVGMIALGILVIIASGGGSI